MAAVPVPIDCVILGGGAAGLWTLDAVIRSGRSAILLEAGELGAGQTASSQGIIHGGFKYTLHRLLTAAASAVAPMPDRWRRSLAGEIEPDLSAVRVRAQMCHLWQTRSLRSAIGMLGARAGLRVTPDRLDDDSRPLPLRGCPGTVARIDEQVIDPLSLLHVLSSRHRGRILKIDLASGLELRGVGDGWVERVALIHPESGESLDLHPRAVVLAAGAGNERLRAMAGLPEHAAQRRPLHMMMVRGDLPALNGHCVDGAKTRVTITSAEDSGRRMVWQVGGAVAESGVDLDASALIDVAREELCAVLPGFAPIGGGELEWAAYRIDRAERRTGGGLRPDDAQCLAEDASNVITAWPTKLALVPRLADLIVGKLPAPALRFDTSVVDGWPHPIVALPPWETASSSWVRR